MDFNKWTELEEKFLEELLQTNTSFTDISYKFLMAYHEDTKGFETLRSSQAISRKIRRMRKSVCINPIATTISAVDPDALIRWEYIKKIGKEYKLKAIDTENGRVGELTRKILSLSDIHFPFAREDDIARIVNEHADADIVVLNGDIIDGYIFSTFSKSKSVPALKEYQQAFTLVETLASKFPKVILVEGNHEIRSSRAIADTFTKDASQILRPDLLVRIANGERLDDDGNLTELVKWSNVTYEKYDSWYVRIGKTIFAHPHAFSGGTPGGTVRKVDAYFANRLQPGDFDSIVIGHTHTFYKGVVAGRLLIEQGALCARVPYEHKPNLKFQHSTCGYAVVYQDKDGNTDFNFSGPIYVGSEIPPKKAII